MQLCLQFTSGHLDWPQLLQAFRAVEVPGDAEVENPKASSAFWYCRHPFEMHLLRNRIPPAPLLLSAAQSPADIALRRHQHQQRQHFEPWNAEHKLQPDATMGTELHNRRTQSSKKVWLLIPSKILTPAKAMKVFAWVVLQACVVSMCVIKQLEWPQVLQACL